MRVARASGEIRVSRSLLCALIAGAFGILLAGKASAGKDPEHESVLAATLVRVVDGDTIIVSVSSGSLTVRLHGIDTPERKQEFGGAATKLLRTLVEGKPLEIEPIEQTDGYGRMVAKVFVGSDDINARLVESGYAWAYRRYLRHDPRDESYCKLEADARAAGRGLWVGSAEAWSPPWDFRARQRGEVVSHINYANETAERCIAAVGRKTGAEHSGWRAPR